MTLDEAVAVWAAQHSECSDSETVRDKCHEYSDAFVEFLGFHYIYAETVQGFEMSGNVILQGHVANLVGSDVYDWTARQFDPSSPVPTVTPLPEWRSKWQLLPEECQP